MMGYKYISRENLMFVSNFDPHKITEAFRVFLENSWFVYFVMSPKMMAEMAKGPSKPKIPKNREIQEDISNLPLECSTLNDFKSFTNLRKYIIKQNFI